MNSTPNCNQDSEKFNILKSELGVQFEPLKRCRSAGHREDRLVVVTDSANELQVLQAKQAKIEERAGFAIEFVLEEPERLEVTEPELTEADLPQDRKRLRFARERLPYYSIEPLFIDGGYVRHESIGLAGLAVLNVISKHADNVTGELYPSYQTIGEQIGISRRTVIRKIKALEELGVIRVESRKKADGSLSSNLITIQLSYKWKKI